MSFNLSIHELVSQFDKESIKSQVFDQLIKDFSRSGIQLNVDSNSKTQQWIEELIIVLNKLYHNNSNQLHQLLYLIDVPQEYYSKTQELQKDEIGMFFAELILLRTLKKIAYRNQYS
jgi:acid phosphatase class B